MSEAYYRDKGLFRGTAYYYARFRPPYPEAVFQYIRQSFNLDGSGELLDLGCGPGDLALPLAGNFKRVTALDADREMLEEGERRAAESAVYNITWIQAWAEDLPAACGPFRLVTIGKAFHWMDQSRVLETVISRLLPGGGLALVGESGRIWQGDEPWQAAVRSVLRKFLGPQRRAGTGLMRSPGEKWEDLLSRYFPVTRFGITFQSRDVWTVESLLGYLYSTSYSSREILGPALTAFERELTATLLELNPENRFVEIVLVSVLLGWKGGRIESV